MDPAGTLATRETALTEASHSRPTTPEQELPIAIGHVATADDAVVDGRVIYDPHRRGLELLDSKPRQLWALTSGDIYMMVQKRLGVGAESYVYHVQEVASGLQYALKMVPLETATVGGLRDTLNTVRQLRHPNIIQCYEYFTYIAEQSAFVCVTLEYCKKGSLRSYVSKKKQQRDEITAEAVCTFISQVASALAYIHEQGLLHGDLCPDTVLRSREREVKLAGFASPCSCRHGRGQPLTITGGRRSHAPPEWVNHPAPRRLLTRGEVASSYDMWGLGCLLHDLATTTLLEEDPPAGPGVTPADPEWLAGMTTNVTGAHGGIFSPLGTRLLVLEAPRRLPAARVPRYLPRLPKGRSSLPTWIHRPLALMNAAPARTCSCTGCLRSR